MCVLVVAALPERSSAQCRRLAPQPHPVDAMESSKNGREDALKGSPGCSSRPMLPHPRGTHCWGRFDTGPCCPHSLRMTLTRPRRPPAVDAAPPPALRHPRQAQWQCRLPQIYAVG